MNYVRAISLCVAIAITSGAFFVASSPVFGREPIIVYPSDVIVRHVSYADLNLASMSGEKTLNLRVNSAVTGVCVEATGSNATASGFYSRMDMTRCSGRAWTDARPQIARAVQRARELASTGRTSIAAAALTISVPTD